MAELEQIPQATAHLVAKRRHELEHSDGFDDRPWDALPSGARSVKTAEAREDLEAAYPAIRKQVIAEVEEETDRFIEANTLRSQDCGDVVPVTSLESFVERLKGGTDA